MSSSIVWIAVAIALLVVAIANRSRMFAHVSVGAFVMYPVSLLALTPVAEVAIFATIVMALTMPLMVINK